MARKPSPPSDPKVVKEVAEKVTSFTPDPNPPVATPAHVEETVVVDGQPLTFRVT